MSVLGAWRNAIGQQELDGLFTSLGTSFSDCTSYEVELLTYDVPAILREMYEANHELWKPAS